MEGRILLKIPNVRALRVNEFVYSEPVQIEFMPWKLGVRSEIFENSHYGKHLGVNIFGNYDDESEWWSCDAKADFRIVNHFDDILFRTSSQDRQLFSRDANGFGPVRYMEWDEFVDEENGWVVDGVAVIEVIVTVYWSKGVARRLMNFGMKMANFSDFCVETGDGKLWGNSKILAQRSEKFRDIISRSTDTARFGDKYRFKELILFLEFLHNCGRDITDKTVKILLKFSAEFGYGDGVRKCIEYLETRSDMGPADKTELLDKYRIGRISNDEEEQLDIDFEDVDPDLTDLVLKVNGKSLKVAKNMLAHESTVFTNIIFTKNLGKKTITIDNVDTNEFLELLQLIYQPFRGISGDNYKGLLKLAARFNIGLILRKVEIFLMTYQRLELVEKLKIAGEFKFICLLERCRQQIGSIEALCALKRLNAMKDVDPVILGMLLMTVADTDHSE